ncbi:MAG: hypothetical protein WA172_23105 [Terriglobales bacterium]
MKRDSRVMRWAVVATLCLTTFAGAQVLSSDQLKKVIPNTFFFSGQVATVQARNSTGLKNSAGKLVLAGLVDTTGYATSIAEKFQGFLITDTKLSFGDRGATLEPGCYGFGFKDGKLTVMNVAGTDLFSVASQNDAQLKHPVPLKLEKSDTGYRLYAGRTYAAVKAD